MQYPFPPEIEQLVTAQLATGKYSSENEVLMHALRTLTDYDESVADIQEGIADEAAGRMRPLCVVDSDLRQKLGFTK
jgi:Arc/MetJ-type ribon-helix-helix transcriptional regulator